MKRIVSLCCAFFCTLALQAQEDVKQQINKIKDNEHFVYAEKTDVVSDSALVEAKYELLYNLNEVLESEGESRRTFEQIESQIAHLTVPRGERTRVFAYLNYWTLLGREETIPQSQEETVPENVQEEAVQKAEPEPENVSQLVVETIQEELPVSETPQAEATQSDHGVNMNDVVEALLLMETYSDTRSALEQFKLDGIITDWGTSRKSGQASLYIICIRKGKLTLETILGPEKDGVRQNMRTNVADSLQNYKDRYVIWFY